MGHNVCSKDHNGTKWQAGQKAQGYISLTLNSTKKLCLSTLSASPLLLLVSMHASNIHRNQAWAFVFYFLFFYCLVHLRCAVIESQSCLLCWTKLTQMSASFFHLWVFKLRYCSGTCSVWVWFERNQSEFTKIQSQTGNHLSSTLIGSLYNSHNTHWYSRHFSLRMWRVSIITASAYLTHAHTRFWGF